MRFTSGLRPPRVSLSTSKTCCGPAGKSCPSASPRSAKASATRLPPATSSSGSGRSSRWNWKDFCVNVLHSIGIKKESIQLRDHSPEELSHYSNATTDIEFYYPFGLKELWGIADRTDYDLKAHAKESGEALEYLDSSNGQKVVPYCIEPSVGVDRLTLAVLCDAYEEEDLGNGDSRVVLHLAPVLAPYKAAILPLQKKLSQEAMKIYEALSADMMVDFDVTGSIGKRYRRQDEIGTPYCITVDFDTLEDGTVTIRDRDTMEQIRVPVAELTTWLQDKTAF